MASPPCFTGSNWRKRSSNDNATWGSGSITTRPASTVTRTG